MTEVDRSRQGEQQHDLELPREREQTPDPDAEILRTMGNAYRMRAYDALLVFGDMTARRLATRTSMSEASLNRHMLELERIRFAYPLNPDAPVRQRVWHAVPGGVRLGVFTEDDTPGAHDWLRGTHEAEMQVLGEWMTHAASWPERWRAAVERWDYILPAITAEQLDQLGDELHAVADKWMAIAKDQARRGDVDGALPAFMITHALPYPMPYPHADADDA